MRVQHAGFAPNYVEYTAGWELQRRTHAAVVAGDLPATLLLLEHASVYTAGKRTEPSERPSDGSPVVDVDRGGKITWHGPGQLVGYPILRLDDPVDVVAYVRRLETMMIDALADVGVAGTTVPGRSGVWLTDNGREDKIAAIGVRVERGVTMHGFAINVSNTLDGFNNIVPCGIRDAGVTTIERETGVTLSPAHFAETMTRAFEREFTGVLA